MSDNRLSAAYFAFLTSAAAASLYFLKCKRAPPRWWVRPWADSRRGTLAMAHNEMRNEDVESFTRFFRMKPEVFDLLLLKIEDKIKKKDTLMRDSHAPRERLSATLRYLASGEYISSLQYSTRIPKQTLSKIIPEVLTAIVEALSPHYLKAPSTTGEWLKIAEDFNEKWQFPNCLGAIDGKHVSFYPHKTDGSYFRNYKGTDSIVLMAAVDANKKFILLDIGCNGRMSDGGVLERSDMGQAIMSNELNFPAPQPLPGRRKDIPFVFVGDSAFRLSGRLMKPFKHIGGMPHRRRVFNYRLSRARHVVEGAFGILASRFRILRNPIPLAVEKVELVTLACCVLHNFLLDHQPVETDEIIKPWEGGSTDDTNTVRRSTGYCHSLREEFIDFFNTNGTVPWQDRMIENFRF